MGEPGLNDMVLLPRPLFTDPQNAGPAPSVKYFCVVITLRSPGPVMGGCLSTRRVERSEAAVHSPEGHMLC